MEALCLWRVVKIVRDGQYQIWRNEYARASAYAQSFPDSFSPNNSNYELVHPLFHLLLFYLIEDIVATLDLVIEQLSTLLEQFTVILHPSLVLLRPSHHNICLLSFLPRVIFLNRLTLFKLIFASTGSHIYFARLINYDNKVQSKYLKYTNDKHKTPAS